MQQDRFLSRSTNTFTLSTGNAGSSSLSTLDYLLEHGVFRVGRSLKCPTCELEFWLALDDVNTEVSCGNVCPSTIKLSVPTLSASSGPFTPATFRFKVLDAKTNKPIDDSNGVLAHSLQRVDSQLANLARSAGISPVLSKSNA
jgi:hypothetical protein